jgi:UDP-N-acetylmuramoyl-tripeptide--D-alanyl-D-alanine ligase
MLSAPLRALALATVKPFPSVLVLEFAAGPHGDIQRTADAAPPTVAVVTAIGPAHLEQFGTLERIVHEKGALVRAVSPSGLVVLGAASAPLAELERQSAAPVVKIEGRGRALSENAARAVCDFLGIPREVTERALAMAPPAVPGRLNVLELGPFTVIDDSYNANPLSMQLGLDTLASRAGPGIRRVAVLGDMKELGPEATRYHDEIAEYAGTRADVIIGVGPLARHYRPEHWFETSDQCAEALPSLLAPGDCVLVKGSNSVALDKVVRAARQMAGDPKL